MAKKTDRQLIDELRREVAELKGTVRAHNSIIAQKADKFHPHMYTEILRPHAHDYRTDASTTLEPKIEKDDMDAVVNGILSGTVSVDEGRRRLGMKPIKKIARPSNAPYIDHPKRHEWIGKKVNIEGLIVDMRLELNGQFAWIKVPESEYNIVENSVADHKPIF